jgi:NAD(P)-dependent dehydrogenase (short-subunit alcohol dehydrogenase family)
MSKTAIITGGSRGIGYAVVRQLGGEGYRVAILDVNAQTDYQDKFDALTTVGIDWMYQQGSIASAEDRATFVKAVVDKYGEIDVLVNNAGVAPKARQDILEMSEESFDYVVGANLKGTVFMTQWVVNQMLQQPIKGQKRGTVVNITSSSVTVSSPNRAEYCMAKAGLSAMSTIYADRLAKDRILVYEIRPGVIDTDMTKVVHEKYSKLIGEGVFPIARWGLPEDCALAVSAFCDDKFIYTTGNYVDVDGGFHIKRL